MEGHRLAPVGEVAVRGDLGAVGGVDGLVGGHGAARQCRAVEGRRGLEGPGLALGREGDGGADGVALGVEQGGAVVEHELQDGDVVARIEVVVVDPVGQGRLPHGVGIVAAVGVEQLGRQRGRGAVGHGAKVDLDLVGGHREAQGHHAQPGVGGAGQLHHGVGVVGQRPARVVGGGAPRLGAREPGARRGVEHGVVHRARRGVVGVVVGVGGGGVRVGEAVEGAVGAGYDNVGLAGRLAGHQEGDAREGRHVPLADLDELHVAAHDLLGDDRRGGLGLASAGLGRVGGGGAEGGGQGLERPLGLVVLGLRGVTAGAALGAGVGVAARVADGDELAGAGDLYRPDGRVH